jgi:hypothetical protein
MISIMNNKILPDIFNNFKIIVCRYSHFVRRTQVTIPMLIEVTKMVNPREYGH